MKIKYFTTIALIGSIALSCGTKKTAGETEEVVIIPKTEYETIDESNMDKKVSPKEDFFQFSNGTWCKENPVPDSESRWGSFNELDQANKAKLTIILNEAALNNDVPGSQNQILGDYYSTFINMDNRNAASFQEMTPELDLITRINSKDEIPAVLAELHKNGIGAFFYFGVGQDLKNVEKNIASLFQGGIGLPNRDYYDQEGKIEILKAYESHITRMFDLLGTYDVDSKKATEQVLNFEKTLASAMMLPAEMRIPEKTYNKVSYEKIEALFSPFKFKSYLDKTGIGQLDKIIVGQPDFVQTAGKLYENTDLETWKSYLTWSVINHYAGHLDENFVSANFDFYGKTLKGQKEMKSINDRAIEEITQMEFGELLGKAFVEKHYSDNAQKRVNEMVDNLLLVFGDRIQNLSWMTETTKKEALTKLNSIGRKLGFPDKWEDYSKIGFNNVSYIENYRKAHQFAYNKNIAKLNKAVDKEEWGMPAHMVNAYYHPLLNEIAFPAGIMQPPFFSETYEDAVNYGRIGMVIGHEFTHGFDDMGSKFAADGSFTNWWSEEDRKSFEEKTGILGQTYSAFCPTEHNCVNPELTMGENIADLGGLTMAYHAYTKTDEFKSGISRNGYTPAQRFFIAYAQLWKINYTEAEMQNRLANDSHSPGMYRVNGPLKNCPEFFEAFDVKEGDKMRNPAGKVAIIW
jgi:putative endopeptidase